MFCCSYRFTAPNRTPDQVCVERPEDLVFVFIAIFNSKPEELTNSSVFSIYVLVSRFRSEGRSSFSLTSMQQNRYATMGLVFFYWIKPRDNLGTHEVGSDPVLSRAFFRHFF